MKNFNSILKLFEEPGYMEFCEDFSMIQSILDYCNEFIRSFQKIQYRGGNEPYINGIVAKFRLFLQSKGYISADKEINQIHDKKLRKIAFFLILNTEMNLKYNLMEDQSVCHLINITPQLSKFLLHTLIWELNLNCYFYECIAYTPSWFALQLIENAVDSLKYADPYEIIDRVEHIVTAIVTNVARSDYRIMGNVDKKVLLSKFYDCSMDFLRHYFTPDIEKLEEMSKYQFSLYCGYVLKHILNAITVSAEIYEKKPILELPFELKIYSLMEDKEGTHNDQSTVYSDTVKEINHRIIVALLNSLQHNVMQVTCQIFMIWVEEEIDDEQTLQSVVGNATFRIQKWLEENEHFKHDVVNQLASISIKPLTVKEMASIATLGEIMIKLDKLTLDIETRRIWITEFIKRGELVLDNDECLDTLLDNVRFLTVGNIQEMLVFVAKQDDAESIDDKLRECILQSLNNFHEDEIKTLILFCLSLKIDNKIESDNFKSSLIEAFNKTTMSFHTKDNLKLMFENANIFFEKIFDEALRNDQQLNNFIEFIIVMPQISQHFLEKNLRNLIDETVLKLPIQEQNRVPSLIHQIYLTNIISKDEIVSKIMYKSLLNALGDKVYSKILILMKAFLTIGIKNDFGKLNAPVLVMTGQVLDHCRWDMIRYTEELENIVQKSIEFIQEVMKKFLPIATENEKSWILSKITAFKPITRYYFHKLSLKKEETAKHFDDFLQENTKHDQLNVISHLCEMVVRCTRKETVWLVKNPIYLDKFPNVIILLSEVVARTTVENSINCYRHCAQCYIHILKDFILPNREDKIELFQQQIEILSKWQDTSIYDELFLHIQSTLLDILEQSFPMARNQSEEIKSSIEKLNDCKSKILMLHKVNAIFEIES